jgi:hypothetical protein
MWRRGRRRRLLSPALYEADLMRRVLPPDLLGRTEGKAVHLYGLALSRAWQLRLLTGFLEDERATCVAGHTAAQVAAIEAEIAGRDESKRSRKLSRFPLWTT